MELPTIGAMAWCAAVAVGYPVLVVTLIEGRRMLSRRLPGAASLCGLVQFTVLPLAAVYLLLTQVAGMDGAAAAPKLLLSALVLTVINALLAGLNAIFLSGVLQWELTRRIPALVLDLVRLVIVLMTAAFVASRIWSVDLGSLLAALGVGSVVLGLALQDTLSGLFAGVSLMSGRHFKEGDWIESGEVAGKIIQLDWRSVTVETLDDEHLVVIPNSELAKGQFKVINTTTRPFGQSVRICFSYATPPARIIAAIRRAIEAVDLLLAEPAPGIDLVAMSDMGVEFEVTIHALTREDGDEGLTQFYRKLWYVCRREGIALAGAVNRRYSHGEPSQPSAAELREILSRTAIFPAAAEGFEALAAGARFELYDDGERLLRADGPFDQIHLVLSGSLTAGLGEGDDQRRVVQAVNPGEFFVRRAYLTGGEAGVDLRASGETATLAISAPDALEFLNRNPPLARAFDAAIDVTERSLAALVFQDAL